MRVAGDLMPKVLYTVRPETSLAECAELFRDHDLRHLPVVGAGGGLLGLVTEEGVYRWGALAGDPPVWMPFGDDGPPSAGGAAEPVEVRFSPEESIRDLGVRLSESTQDFAVAVRGDAAVGIVTEHDLVWLSQWVLPDALGVEAVMSHPVHTVDASSAAGAAWTRMIRQGLRHLVVVDGATPRSVISLRDLVAEEVPRGRPATVADVARGRKALTIDRGASLTDAACRMVSFKVGSLPVVDDRGSLVGIVTRRDAIRAMLDHLQGPVAVPEEALPKP